LRQQATCPLPRQMVLREAPSWSAGRSTAGGCWWTARAARTCACRRCRTSSFGSHSTCCAAGRRPPSPRARAAAATWRPRSARSRRRAPRRPARSRARAAGLPTRARQGARRVHVSTVSGHCQCAERQRGGNPWLSHRRAALAGRSPVQGPAHDGQCVQCPNPTLTPAPPGAGQPVACPA